MSRQLHLRLFPENSHFIALSGRRTVIMMTMMIILLFTVCADVTIMTRIVTPNKKKILLNVPFRITIATYVFVLCDSVASGDTNATEYYSMMCHVSTRASMKVRHTGYGHEKKRQCPSILIRKCPFICFRHMLPT